MFHEAKKTTAVLHDIFAVLFMAVSAAAIVIRLFFCVDITDESFYIADTVAALHGNISTAHPVKWLEVAEPPANLLTSGLLYPLVIITGTSFGDTQGLSPVCEACEVHGDCPRDSPPLSPSADSDN